MKDKEAGRNWSDAIIIRRADPGTEAGRINLFYAGRGSMIRVESDHAVYTAEHDGVIVGAVRLCREEGQTMLRTMHVHAGYRRHGIGQRLLEAFQEEVRDADCYCIPFAHLVNFYGTIGFALIAPDHAPPHIRQRLEDYRAHGMDAIVMKRHRDIALASGTAGSDSNSGSFSED